MTSLVVGFDDGYDDNYTYSEVFSSRGVGATIYLQTNAIDTGGLYITKAHADALYADGWDFGNHTTDHSHMTTLDDAGRQSVIVGADAYLQATYPRAAKHFAYPYGETDAATKASCIAAGMLSLRLYSGTGLVASSTDIHALPCLQLDSNVSLAAMLASLDTAAAAGSDVFAFGHHLAETAGELTWAASDMSDLLDYALGLGFHVDTVGQWYARRYPSTGHGIGFYVPTYSAGTWTRGPYTYLI